LQNQELYKYLRLFGFGSYSGVYLPGEVKGIVRPVTEWSARSAATIAYGQEIAVTPLQLINGYNSFAFDGVLYEPQIVKSIHFINDQKIEHYGKQKIRKVIGSKTKNIITQGLITVVENGTGKKAELDYIPVAGKTGTAQYIDHNTGEYLGDRTIPSFIGFLPADDPQYSCLIIIKNPTIGSSSGGYTAAPVFRKVFERIFALPENKLQEYLVEKKIYFPNRNSKFESKKELDFAKYQLTEEEIQIPDFKNFLAAEAKIAASKLGLKTIVYGNGMVYGQDPKPMSVMKTGRTIVFYAKKTKDHRPKQQKKNFYCGPEIVERKSNDSSSSF